MAAISKVVREGWGGEEKCYENVARGKDEVGSDREKGHFGIL